MVDLCTGPHLPNTGYLKTQAVNNLSRAFWRADVSKDPLQVPLTLLLPLPLPLPPAPAFDLLPLTRCPLPLVLNALPLAQHRTCIFCFRADAHAAFHYQLDVQQAIHTVLLHLLMLSVVLQHGTALNSLQF